MKLLVGGCGLLVGNRRRALTALFAGFISLICLASSGCKPQQAASAPQRAAALRPAPEAPAKAAAHPAAEVGLPFFWLDENTFGRRDWEAFGPLAGGWSRPGNRVFMFRPLCYLEDEGPGSERWDFRAIWPFVWAARDGESGRFHIFPFIWWDRQVDRAGGEPVRQTDWAVMPVLWGGSSTARGGYFAVFPVGGLLKGKLGQLWIRFAAFPIWVDYENTNYHSWNVVWPVFSVWRGPDTHGWRVWPLYGIDQRDGRYRRVFVLWPFGHHWQMALDTPHPSDTWVVFPFWMSYRGNNLTYWSVMWPFVGRKESTAKGSEYVEWHAPWPFISWTRGTSVRGYKVFPFYMRRVGAAGESRQVLWPLYASETTDESPERVTVVTSAFIFRHVRREWLVATVDGRQVRQLPPLPEERQKLAAARNPGSQPEPVGRKDRPVPEAAERSATATLLWPVFRYERDEHGQKFFTTLEPWWFRNRKPFDRLYGPFISLYRYESFADGTVRDHAAFNLYEHTRSTAGRSLRLTPIFDYGLRRPSGAKLDEKIVEDGGRRFRVLYGLFGYERRGTAKRVRLLWIPIGRRPEGWDEMPVPTVAPPVPESPLMPATPGWPGAGPSPLETLPLLPPELLPETPGPGGPQSPPASGRVNVPAVPVLLGL